MQRIREAILPDIPDARPHRRSLDRPHLTQRLPIEVERRILKSRLFRSCALEISFRGRDLGVQI